MSLLKYVRNLGTTFKNDLLSSSVTKLLRQTFCDDEYGVLPDSIIDGAVVSSRGYQLVKNKKHRERIIDVLPLPELGRIGFESYQHARNELGGNAQRFVESLDIEEHFLLESRTENRNQILSVHPKFGSDLKSRGFLHPYQKRIKDDLLRSIWSESAMSSRLCLMPTGAGKTTVALELVCDLIRTHYVKVIAHDRKPFKFLWVVEGDHLAEQSLIAMRDIWNLRGDQKIELRRYFTPFNENSVAFDSSKTSPFGVFATFSLLTSRINDHEILAFMKECDLMIVDEAHSSKAETYLNAIHAYFRNNQNKQLLGLTATPYRSDDGFEGKLKDLFQRQWTIIDDDSRALESPIQWLVSNEYLSKLEVHQINQVRSNIGDFKYYKDLHESVLEICRLIESKGENLIIFAETMAHAIALNLFLSHMGIENGLIIGDTPNEERERILGAVKDPVKSKMHVVVNHHILSKGLDIPGLNSIMILGTTNNPALALQLIGRAMRGPKNGGNKSNTLYLTRDNYQFLNSTKVLESVISES